MRKKTPEAAVLAAASGPFWSVVECKSIDERVSVYNFYRTAQQEAGAIASVREKETLDEVLPV